MPTFHTPPIQPMAIAFDAESLRIEKLKVQMAQDVDDATRVLTAQHGIGMA